MPPDRAETTRRWLEKAATDILAPKQLLRSKPVLTEPIVFFAQQAAEKAIKAFLVSQAISFQKTHDIADLARFVVPKLSALEPLLKKAARLTPFAVIFRYPREGSAPTRQEAEEALELAEKLYSEILQQVPVGGRPT